MCAPVVMELQPAKAGRLALDLVAEIFDGLADVAAGFAEAFFDVTFCLIAHAFLLHLAIVDGATDVLFHRALSLVPFAFEFIPVHSHSSRLISARRSRIAWQAAARPVRTTVFYQG